MQTRRWAAFALSALVVAACGSSSTSKPAATTAGGGSTGGGCTVGVSWNNFQEQRWAKWDEPAIKAAIEAGGGTYISNDAKSSAETQATNMENLISQGAKVLIVLAQDGTADQAGRGQRDRQPACRSSPTTV